MNELEMRQLYVELQPGDRVEVIHHIKIGFREHDTRTVGTVVKKERRQCGIDSGFARNWDDKYWFDHLLLRKDDGELTSLTMDEYTQLKQLEPKEARTGNRHGEERPTQKATQRVGGHKRR